MHPIPFKIGSRYSKVNERNHQMQKCCISVVCETYEYNHGVNAELAYNYGCTVLIPE